MLRNRLVRQSAVSISSSSESTSMSSPPPLRRRRNSQDTRMFRQMSSESLDQLLKTSNSMSSSHSYEDTRTRGGRRHSVACGVLFVDGHKPSIKSAFNTAVRRMSDACSLLSSAPSSTYNLSVPPKKENEVILPNVLRTYRAPPPKSQSGSSMRSNFQINRRFSTDCPPPSYTEATSGWKQPTPKQQKVLIRQSDVVTSNKTSLVALEDDDIGVREQN